LADPSSQKRLPTAAEGARHARRQRPRQHGRAELGLGRERDLVRHIGPRAPLGVAGPALGQVERAVDQGVPLRAGVGEEHADLAVLDPARGAGILPLHADRMRALLHEAGLIQHQHRPRIAQVLDDVGPQVVADPIGVPTHPTEEILHPVGRGIPGGFGQLPTVLALDRRQQPTQVGQRTAPRLDPAEARRDPSAQPLQLRSPGSRILESSHGTSSMAAQYTAKTAAVVLEPSSGGLGPL
jgi:hypothetical protein